MPNPNILRKVIFPGSGIEFLPTNLSAVVADFDSDNTGTTYITKDGSNNVSAWVDITGNRNVVQGTGSNQPNWNENQINGHPTIDFNGTGDLLKEMIADYLIGSNTGTIFSVCISNNNSDENIISSGNEGGTTDYVIINKSPAAQNTIKIAVNNAGAVDQVRGDINLSDNSPHILTYNSNGSSYGLRIDGGEQTVNESIGGDDSGIWFGDISNRDNLGLGALIRSSTSFQVSRFARIIICDSILSDVDEALVERFLATRYNISI
jgi:hypothetical protein